MNRRAVRRNHANRIPSRCLFLDCETTTHETLQSHSHHEHVYRLSVTQYWVRVKECWRERDTHCWKSAHEMWDYIFKLARGEDELYVFAHNAMFDLTVSHFWDYLDGGAVILHGDREYHTGRNDTISDERSKWQGLFVADDRRVIIECCGPHGRLKVLDSMNYHRCSLEKLGESIGVPKHPMPSFDEDDATWTYYCINDVKVLAQSMIDLMREWKEQDYGNWQPTASALAWSCYRHRFMPRTIYSHDDPLALSLERAANFGGECRSFFVGDVKSEYQRAIDDFSGKQCKRRPNINGPVHLYDVRSLYPSVMASEKMPCRLLHSQNESTPAIIKRLCEDYFVIANVHVNSKRSRFPKRLNGGTNLPEDSRLCFPIGDYHTTLCGAELRDAIDNDEVVSSSELACYEQDMLFAGYVNHWHSKRMEAVDDSLLASAEFCKLMLNSLYGRFSMRTSRWAITPNIYPAVQWGTFLYDDAASNRLVECRSVGGNVLTLQDASDDVFSLVAIAAAITSAGRYRMRQHRDLLPARSVLYQDTDSLLLTAEGREIVDRLSSAATPTLGCLRHVATFDDALLCGQRNLTLDGEDRIAGLPKLREALGCRRYSAQVWERPESLLSRPCPDTVRVEIRSFDCSRVNVSDVETASGWTTPLILRNDAPAVTRQS